MFENPWIFLLILPLGFLVLKPLLGGGPRAPSLERWRTLAPSWRQRFFWVPELWDILLLGTLAFLLAGPQAIVPPQDTQRRGLSLAVVLDRSASMGAQVDSGDEKITRFEGVKTILKEFFHRRPQDAVTLISFAGFPETHTPLTTNPEVLSMFLDIIPLAMDNQEGGTAIGDALVLAAARLKNARAPGEKNTGAIILLTDGQNNSGEATPDEGARLAKALGIKIFPIGLGGRGILSLGPGSREAVDLDAVQLKKLAVISKGTYFQADSLQALDGIIKALESGELSTLKSFQPPVKKLDLDPCLWVLFFLTLGSPLIRLVIFRRSLP